MLGCSEDSLIGKGTRILYENDLEYERVVKALSAGLREQGWASVESRQRVGDRFCDVILIVSPIQPDDFSAGIIAISYDITERKETEKKLERYRKKLEERVESRTSELQAAKDQLEAIFQSANVGIVVLRERLILQCNAQLEVIFGYGAGELTGQSTRLWYSDEASYTNTGKIVNEQIRRGEIHRCEQQLRRKDGSLFWARMTGRALDLADPDKGGMVGVVEDITAEREAADALRLAMAEQQAIFDSATSLASCWSKTASLSAVTARWMSCSVMLPERCGDRPPATGMSTKRRFRPSGRKPPSVWRQARLSIGSSNWCAKTAPCSGAG